MVTLKVFYLCYFIKIYSKLCQPLLVDKNCVLFRSFRRNIVQDIVLYSYNAMVKLKIHARILWESLLARLYKPLCTT